MPPGAPIKLKLAYQPNPKQREFHQLNGKFRGFCGGWGNGKTSGGCAEFFLRLMEFPGTNSIIARKTRPELRATTWDMFINGDTQEHGWRGLPGGVKGPLVKTYNKSDLYLELMNGSRVHGLPLDDPKKIENYNLGLFMIDQAEEVEEEIFLKFHGRLRQHNAPREGLLLFNPDGHNYLWRRFIDKKRKAHWAKQYKCIEATPFDNPNLPDDYLEQFEGLPDHWFRRYVLGSHEVFVGQIFTDWNPDVHIIDPFYIPEGWERWCSIDPGIGHHGAVSWIARDGDDNCYYYREIVEQGKDVSWWAEAIQEAEERSDWGGPNEELTYPRLIGMESQQRAQTDGRTVYQVYEEEGIDDLELADRDPVARINRITSRLRLKPKHVHPLGIVAEDDPEGDRGAPKLYVFSDCGYTTEHLPQYRWRPQRILANEEDRPEKVRKKDDHTVDNLGHVLVAIGDSLPEVADAPGNVLVARPREHDEHFDAEMAVAAQRAPLGSFPHRTDRRDQAA
jgi:phage terminase large subunit